MNCSNFTRGWKSQTFMAHKHCPVFSATVRRLVTSYNHPLTEFVHRTFSRGSLHYWKVCSRTQQDKRKLPRSWVRKLKHLYLQILKEVGSTTEISHSNRRHSLKLGNCRFIYVNIRSINVALALSSSVSALFLGQYFKNANFFGTKLILNSNSQTLMAAEKSGSTVTCRSTIW